MNFKNPDSLSVYDVKFYDGLNEDDDNSESEDTETESSDGESKDQSSDSPKYPTVVMHCGAQMDLVEIQKIMLSAFIVKTMENIY